MSMDAKFHLVGNDASGHYDYWQNIYTSEDDGVFYETALQNGFVIRAWTLLNKPEIRVNGTLQKIQSQFDISGLLAYIESKKSTLNFDDADIVEIGNFLNSFTFYYTNIYTTPYGNFEEMNVNGVLVGQGMPFGSPITNAWGSTGTTYLWSTHTFQGQPFTAVEPAQPMCIFNLMTYAHENELYAFSDSFIRKLAQITPIINYSTSFQWDVFINTNKEKLVNKTESVLVRWRCPAVEEATPEYLETDPNYSYRADNTTIMLRIADNLSASSTTWSYLSDLLYGDNEFTFQLNNVVEKNFINQVASFLPFTSLGDLYLYVYAKFSTGKKTSICIGQIPLNSLTQDTSHLKTVQGSDGSTITLHYGLPVEGSYIPAGVGWNLPTDFQDDTQNYPSDTSDVETQPGTNTNISLLTKTYAIDNTNLQTIGETLWDSNLFENFALVNNSPIENIISVKSFPFEISASGEEEVVKIANVPMTGAKGVKLPSTYNPIKTIGTFTIPKKYSGVLEWLNYMAKVTVFLPYIGFVELTDFNPYYGKQITLKYIYDVITGSCTACFYSEGIEFAKYGGNIAIDIPITASNRAQIENGLIINGITGIVSTLTGNIMGGASALMNMGNNLLEHNAFTTSGTPSPSCEAFDEQKAFVIVNYPVYEKPSSFGHDYGYPCNLTRRLSSLKGYTKCYNVDVKDFPCTETERDMIKQLLESGVII